MFLRVVRDTVQVSRNPCPLIFLLVPWLFIFPCVCIGAKKVECRDWWRYFFWPEINGPPHFFASSWLFSLSCQGKKKGIIPNEREDWLASKQARGKKMLFSPHYCTTQMQRRRKKGPEIDARVFSEEAGALAPFGHGETSDFFCLCFHTVDLSAFFFSSSLSAQDMGTGSGFRGV